MATRWESDKNPWALTSLSSGYFLRSFASVIIEDAVYGQPRFSIVIDDAGAGSDSVSASVVRSTSITDGGLGTDFVASSVVLSISIVDAGVGTDTMDATVSIDDGVLYPTITDAGLGVDMVFASVVRSASITDVGMGIDVVHVHLTDAREARTWVRFLDSLHSVRMLDDP